MYSMKKLAFQNPHFLNKYQQETSKEVKKLYKKFSAAKPPFFLNIILKITNPAKRLPCKAMKQQLQCDELPSLTLQSAKRLLCEKI